MLAFAFIRPLLNLHVKPDESVHFPNTPFTYFLAAAVLFVPATSEAQSCAPATPPRHAWEVRQEVELVDSTARFGPRLHRPTDRDSLPPNIIEFVVDTVGRPVAGSFRVLHGEDGQLVDAARHALTRWRFRPAQDRGCRVSQITQWILRPLLGASLAHDACGTAHGE
jgi:hypothetical protein